MGQEKCKWHRKQCPIPPASRLFSCNICAQRYGVLLCWAGGDTPPRPPSPSFTSHAQSLSLPCALKVRENALHKFYFTALKGYMSGHYHILLDTSRDFSISIVTIRPAGETGQKCIPSYGDISCSFSVCVSAASVFLLELEHLIRNSKWATSF